MLSQVRKRPEHARHSDLDMIFIFPSPGQQFVDAIDGVAFHHPREHVAQVSVRFDTVQLAGFNQRADDCPSIAATVAAGKEMILASERHGRIARSTGLVSSSMRPSWRKRVKPSQRESA